MSRDQKYIITSDRDEKIRISRYPNSYNIENYCLGHTSFVSSLSLVPYNGVDYLISGDGEGVLFLWDFIVGRSIHNIDVSDFITNDISDSPITITNILYNKNNNSITVSMEK